MRTLLRYAVVLSATYILAWTGSYVLVCGLDFGDYFNYLWAAWTFHADSIPHGIFVSSVVWFLLLAVPVAFVLEIYDRRKKRTA
jgi:large-conductance mechanosensitive channel